MKERVVAISFKSGSFFLLTDMQWLWSQDASRDLLLAVHPPNYIVLWNADTGTKLWKKSYAENILSFSFDPFDPSNLTCKFYLEKKNHHIPCPTGVRIRVVQKVSVEF